METATGEEKALIPREDHPGPIAYTPIESSIAAVPETAEQVMLTRLLEPTALELTDQQKSILFASVPHDIVEIRPDGKIYLPAVEFREVLVQAFGLDWELIPEGPPRMEGKIILWGYYLFVQGKPKAFAFGEQEYQKGDWRMSYGDALEGAKSNALMRCCKQLHIGADLWRPSFQRTWMEEHAETYQKRNRQGEMKTLWKRKVGSFNQEGSGVLPDEEPEQSDAAESESTSDQRTEDPGRFRRTAFLIAEFLQIDDDAMRETCQKMFELPLKDGKPSREQMTPAMWESYLAHLRKDMPPVLREEYDRWLQVRDVVKKLEEKGLEKEEIKLWAEVRFMMPGIMQRPPAALLDSIARAWADKHLPRFKKALEDTQEWAKSIGGKDTVRNLLENLNEANKAAGDPAKGAKVLEGFFSRMMVSCDEDGAYRLRDIMPEQFNAWRRTLESACADAGVEWAADDIQF